MDIERLEFIASLPPIASAIQIHGIGDGAIIKLEIPASEIKSIVQLQSLAGKIFKVTVEEIEDRRYGRKKTETD